jgi:hypothetical protein
MPEADDGGTPSQLPSALVVTGPSASPCSR